MRPRVVISTLLLAACIWSLAVLISEVFRQQPEVLAKVNPPVTQTGANLPPQKPSFITALPPAAGHESAVVLPSVVQEANHADYVRDRVAELMALAMNDDPDSFDIIWSELSNQDKEIRAGALAAIVQFGDRSVTPHLRELAAQTQDPYEKINLLAAADQLDLPPFGSLPAGQPANGSQ